MPEQQQEQGQHFRVDRFEGPLDLLLFLIKRSEIDIHDIPIAEITRQYLEYLEWVANIDLENITDFYLMAATLLYSRTGYLPRPRAAVYSRGRTNLIADAGTTAGAGTALSS